jgi:DNA polymerase-3 subunit epsilon
VAAAIRADEVLSDALVEGAFGDGPASRSGVGTARPGAAARPVEALDAPLSDVTFVVLDLETTGTVPGQSRIIEVAAAKFRGGECLGTFSTLVNPGCGLPPFIVALTGITEALVLPAPTIDEVLPSLLEFIGGAVLVGHNLRFDTSFLDADLLARGRPRIANRRVDTLTLARRLVRDEVPDCRLATLAARFRASTVPTHRALDDVLATADVLHALFERAAGYGVLALDDLLALPSNPLALRKLPLLAGLPRAPGVYVFRAADGRVVHVGRAADVRSRVRSLFVTGGRRRVARLLRETVAIEHIPCGHPLEAAITQLRLHHAHRPWFDGRPRRWKGCAYLKLTTGRFPRLSVVHSARADGAVYLGPFQGVGPARFVRSAIEAALPLRRGAPGVVAEVRRGLSGEPEAILGPLAERLEALSSPQGGHGHRGDVVFAQEQLRALTAALRRQAMLDGLRASGHVTVDVSGHHVELDGGRLVAVDHAPAPFAGRRDGAGSPPVSPAGLPGRAEADELLAVGRWLRREARAGQVRLVGPVTPAAAAALAAVLEGVEHSPA